MGTLEATVGLERTEGGPGERLRRWMFEAPPTMSKSASHYFTVCFPGKAQYLAIVA